MNPHSSHPLLLRAQSLVGARDPEQVLERLEVLRRLHRTVEAASVAESAIAEGHASATLHFKLAGLYRSNRALDRALAHAQAGLALDPKAPELQDLAAELAAQRGDASAPTLIRNAHASSASHWTASFRRLLLIGAFDHAQTLAKHQAQTEGDPLAHTAVARFDLWRGHADAARSTAEAVLAQTPGLVEAHFLQGAAFAMLGDHTASIAALDRALSLPSPAGGWFEPAAAWTWRADALWQAGEWDAARQSADRAMTQSQRYNPAAHGVRMRALATRALLDDNTVPPRLLEVATHLAALMDDADVLRDRDAQAYIDQMSLALQRLGGNRSSTLSTVDGDTLRPFTPPPYPRYLSREIQQQIRVLPAAEVLPKMSALQARFPDDPTPLTYHGELHIWLGDYPAALHCFDRALALDPETVWAWVGIGAAHLLMGDPARALATWKEGIAVVGFTGPTIYAYRGEAYRRIGEYEKARADLEHATTAKPRRLSAWINLALLDAAEDEPGLARSLLAALERTNPGLLDDARAEDEPEVLERILVLMRGNRSTALPAYHTDDNRFRTLVWNAQDAADLAQR